MCEVLRAMPEFNFFSTACRRHLACLVRKFPIQKTLYDEKLNNASIAHTQNGLFLRVGPLVYYLQQTSDYGIVVYTSHPTV